MLRRHRNWTIAAGVCVLLGAAFAWWSYKTHHVQNLAKTITLLASETGTELRNALMLDGRPPAEHTEETTRLLEAHFSAVERYLRKLRSIDNSAVLAAAEAADDYMLTSREILRRLAASHRSQRLFSQNSRALLEHMRNDHGGASWVGQAVRLKNQVEKDYSELDAATVTLARLLASFPDAQLRVVPYFEKQRLVEQSLLDAARQRALASAKQAADEIEKIRKWVPRGQGRHKPL
jgi:hypothetical protein